jgi:hypothetical protein
MHTYGVPAGLARPGRARERAPIRSTGIATETGSWSIPES